MPERFSQNTRRRTRRALALCALMLAWAPPFATAQTQNAPELQTPDAGAGSPQGQKPPSSSLPSTEQNPSETLGRSGGVIKPPGGVDSGISVPPKDSGAGSAMPVIPPPGAPGGNPNVQPK